MRESEKAQVYNEAIDRLVAEAVTEARPKSPGAYAATVRADLRERYRDAAREAFAKYGELIPEHLAILLAAKDAPEPDPEPATPLEPWTGPEVEPDAGPVLTRNEVRDRLAAARAALSATTKPPIGDTA